MGRQDFVRTLSSPTFAALLAVEPETWGLRGDPHLWDEIREELSGSPIPGSTAELCAEIARVFEELTGKALETTSEQFMVPRLSAGGMSSGHVDPAWWREEAIPFLTERHREYVELSKDLEAAVALELKGAQLPTDPVAKFSNQVGRAMAVKVGLEFVLNDERKGPEYTVKGMEKPQRMLRRLANELDDLADEDRIEVLSSVLQKPKAYQAVKAISQGAPLSETLTHISDFLRSWNDGVPRTPKVEEVVRIVADLAVLWRNDFDEDPKAWDGGPFVRVVEVLWQRLVNENPPSWVSIRDALGHCSAKL